MSLDLGLDDTGQALSDAVTQMCSERCDDEVVRQSVGRFPVGPWHDLAEMGVLGAACEEGALTMVAALEPLGRAAFPGPLADTFFASVLLDDDERNAVLSGECVVSVGACGLMAWAPDAAIFLEIDGPRVFRARAGGEIESVETLGGEVWGRLPMEREKELPAERALALRQIALAAYLAAAGARIVADAAAHARTRTQFGRAIGEFQAVAHPLADALIRVDGAGALARAAAWNWDAGQGEAGRTTASTWAAAAWLSARGAALEAAHVAHQVFGAVGITLEGPAYHVTRRIRQLASQPGGESDAREKLLVHIGLAP